MAKRKRRAAAPEKQITRKEYLRQRKDQREQRALLGVLAPVMVVVAIIVLVGVYREMYSKPRTPVARVNGETVSAATFVDRLAFQRRQLLNDVSSLASLASSTDPGTLTQLFEGQRTGIADRTVDLLVDEALIRQEAAKRGLTVTDEDVVRKIDDDLATQIAPPPTPEPTAAAEGEDGDSESSGEGLSASGALTDTASITDTGAITSTATGVPTPSREDLDAAFRDNVQPALDQTGLSRSKFENIVRQQLYREKLTEALGAELTITDKQVEVEYLVFGSRAMAEEASAAVEAGNSWAAVVDRFRRPESTATPEATPAGDADELPEGAATVTSAEGLTTTLPLTLTEPVAPAEPLTPTESLTLTEPLTLTVPATGTGEITATSGVTVSEPITVTAGMTTSLGAGASPEATSTGPTSTPAPTATPDPFAIEVGERAWFTRDGLKTAIGLSDEDADKVMVLAPGSLSEPVAGSRGTYVVWVVDVDEARELSETELEQRRQTAIDEWLQKAREEGQIDKFPLEAILTPEPDWFVQAWQRLVGVPQPTLDLGALDLAVSTTTPGAPAGDAGAAPTP
jgi:hypothetical protein